MLIRDSAGKLTFAGIVVSPAIMTINITLKFRMYT